MSLWSSVQLVKVGRSRARAFGYVDLPREKGRLPAAWEQGSPRQGTEQTPSSVSWGLVSVCRQPQTWPWGAAEAGVLTLQLLWGARVGWGGLRGAPGAGLLRCRSVQPAEGLHRVRADTWEQLGVCAWGGVCVPGGVQAVGY